MANCAVCVRAIMSKHIKLVCNDCDSCFHASCLKMSKADVDCISADGLVWRCAKCSDNRRKSMRLESDVGEGKATIEDVLRAINEVKETQINNEKEFNRAFEAMNAQLLENTNAIKEQNKQNESFMKLAENILAENKTLKQKIKMLEDTVESMQQYSRSNCLEIHGIPQQANENVLDIVKEVGKALDIQIKDEMVDTCHRLGRKQGQGNGSPGIIVKFVRRLDKEEFMRRRRVKRTLSTRHLNRPDDVPIYVNESLTPTRRRLLALARIAKREKAYKFLWVRNGKIFLRKEENAPVLVVSSDEDLSKLQ